MVNKREYIFGRIRKVIVPLNSLNFSTSDRISLNEIKFRNLKALWVGVLPFGVLDIWSVMTPKRRIFGVYAFYRY